MSWSIPGIPQCFSIETLGGGGGDVWNTTEGHSRGDNYTVRKVLADFAVYVTDDANAKLHV